MDPAAPTAVVVGGGIGGVVAALALRRIGWSATVLERTPEPADRGSGITLFPNAMRALDAIGVGNAVRSAGAPVPNGSSGLRRPNGQVVVDGSTVPPVAGLFVFHRADLHRALRKQLDPGMLRTGVEVTAVRATGGRGVVEVADGEPWTADLVVAADGLRSLVRTALHPRHPGPRYAGYTSWRSVTAAPVQLDGVAGETWGAGERFGILPLPDGRVYWFAVANLPPGTRFPAHEEVTRRFGRWHPPIPELLAASAADSVLSLDVYDLTLPLPSFAVGPIALLGDAAHAMTPDVGQGAGQACEDAAVLAASLRGVRNAAGLSAALRHYDAERRPRTERVVAAARRMGRLGQTSAPLAVAMRTALMRLTPPAASLRMIDKITSWTPPVVPDLRR